LSRRPFSPNGLKCWKLGTVFTITKSLFSEKYRSDIEIKSLNDFNKKGRIISLNEIKHMVIYSISQEDYNPNNNLLSFACFAAGGT
jgi:hypothetical protein